jgi:hypothetical protein
MRLSSKEYSTRSETQQNEFNYETNFELLESFNEPSDRIIQNILNYAKSIEVIKHKNNVGLILLN